MPIYEYQCVKCKKSFEYMQSMSDPPKKKCEKCGGKLERVISPAGFVLKGGGWYKDLYASPKPGSESKSEGTSDSQGEGRAKAEGAGEGKKAKGKGKGD